MKKHFILFALFLLVSPLRAEIYKWADSEGNVHFSDKPQPGAEIVILPPTQLYSPEKMPEADVPSAPKINHHDSTVYTKIIIVQPQDQETIRSNQGFVSVITHIEPKLRSGDMLQLIFDGAPLASPQTDLAFALNNVYRGTHTLLLHVLNDKGEVLESSPTVTFFMHHSRAGGGG